MRLGSSLVESSFFQDVECSNLIDQCLNILVMYTFQYCIYLHGYENIIITVS